MRTLPAIASSLRAITILVIGSVCSLHAQQRSPIYPFDVEVGGQAAVPPGGPAIMFANVPQPVAPDARVKVDSEGEMIIVNVFAIDENGSPLSGVAGQAKVIMVQNGADFDLDGTMDKSTLAPGRYGMNIVLQNQGTSRVKFTVGTLEELEKAAAAMKDSAGDGNSPATPPVGSPKVLPSQPRINMAGISGVSVAATVAPEDQSTPASPPASGLNFAGAELVGISSPNPATEPGKIAPSSTGDRSTPGGTMSLFIQYAREGKFDEIRAFASPDCDGDVREICAIADSPEKDKTRFLNFFGGGNVLGEARIEGDEAEVDFTFGDKQEKRETMSLRRIDSVWYLDHF